MQIDRHDWPKTGFRRPFAWLARLAEIIPDGFIPLLQRVAIAAVFWLSGRTKVDGAFTLSDSTFVLFRNDYALPLIPPDLAAYLATGAEHVFPMLLVVGLFTRLSASALIAMTLVIQFFVFPGAWATHMTWIGLLLPLLVWGGGALSLDRALRIA